MQLSKENFVPKATTIRKQLLLDLHDSSFLSLTSRNRKVTFSKYIMFDKIPRYYLNVKVKYMNFIRRHKCMLRYISNQIHQHFLLKFCKGFPYVSHDNTPHGQLNGHDPFVNQQVCNQAYLFPSINQEYTFLRDHNTLFNPCHFYSKKVP